MFAAMVGAQLAGSLIGQQQSKKDRARANELMNEALAEIERVGAPPDLSKEIIYNKFYNAGLMTPQMEQVIEHSVSSAAAKFQSEQENVLKQYGQLSRTGRGLDELVNFIKAQEAIAQQQKAREQTEMQRLKEKGLAGSGSELIFRTSGIQDANRQAAETALQMFASSAANRQSALANQANLAGQLYGQQSAIDLANTQNRRDVNQRDTARKQESERYNTETNQSLATMNTRQLNDELLRQTNARRDNWLDKLSLAGTKSSSYGYFGGGFTTTAVSTIDRLDFSTETVTIPSQKLTTAKFDLAAVSNAN